MNRGYLLVSKANTDLLKYLIDDLDQLQDLIEKNPGQKSLIEATFRKLKDSFKMFDVPHYDEVYVRVVDNLKDIYNELIKSYNLSQYDPLLVQFKCSSLVLKNTYTQDSYFQRLNLVNRYHFILQSVGAESENNNKNESPLEEIASHFKATVATAPALTGLHVIQNNNIKLGEINLVTALTHVWKAIKKFPAKEAAEAKEKLASVLADVQSLSSSDKAKYLLQELIQCLGDTYFKNKDINTKEDVALIIRNHFYTHLEAVTASLSVSDQIKMFNSLNVVDEKQIEVDNNFEKMFSAKIKETLSMDLQAYELIPGINIQAAIDKELHHYFATREARKQMSAILIKQLNQTDRLTSDRLALLRACIQAEQRDPGKSVRNDALEALQKAALQAKSHNKGMITELCDRYQRMREVDANLYEVKTILNNRNKPEHATSFALLDKPIEQVYSTVNKVYSELNKAASSVDTKKSDKTKKSDLDLVALKKKVAEVETKLQHFADDEAKIYLPTFTFSKDYKKTSDKAGDGVLRKVQVIFTEYGANRWQLHFGPKGRHYTAEAKEVADKMGALMKGNVNGETLLAAQLYIHDVLNRLVINNKKFNLTGSFSKRAHYCLHLLDEAQKAELAKKADHKLAI